MKKLITLSIFFVVACSCKDDIESNANIRLSNVSQFDFRNVILNAGDGQVDFGNLDSKQISDYGFFKIAYRNSFIQLEIDGKKYTRQPIDFVGSTPLGSGNYTYEIDANDSQEEYDRLTLTIIEK